MEEALVYFEEAMKLLDSLPETNTNQEHRISLLVNQLMVFKPHFKFVAYYELLAR